MSFIQMLVIGFGVLSAGVWLIALVVNALVFMQRVVVKKPSPLQTVGIVGLVAGVWMFFAARSIWPQLSMVWLAVIFLPQVFAIVANAMDYRKHDVAHTADSDNPKP